MIEVIELVEGIQGVWDRIVSMPGHLLLVLVLNVLGFVLKHTPVPNRFIPLVIIIVGTVVHPAIASPGTVGPDFRNPTMVLALYGFLLGALAWTLHSVAFRHLEKFLPKWLQPAATPVPS